MLGDHLFSDSTGKITEKRVTIIFDGMTIGERAGNHYYMVTLERERETYDQRQVHEESQESHH